MKIIRYILFCSTLVTLGASYGQISDSECSDLFGAKLDSFLIKECPNEYLPVRDSVMMVFCVKVSSKGEFSNCSIKRADHMPSKPQNMLVDFVNSMIMPCAFYTFALNGEKDHVSIYFPFDPSYLEELKNKKETKQKILFPNDGY